MVCPVREVVHLLTLPLRLCDKYGFEKPNDRKALELMNEAAKAVVRSFPQIVIAYGHSDEYR
jgi:tRNA(His) guanylyltransferase